METLPERKKITNTLDFQGQTNGEESLVKTTRRVYVTTGRTNQAGGGEASMPVRKPSQ